MSSSILRRVAFSAPRSTRALSRLTFTGRLTASPEGMATASGMDIVRFTVACSHGRKEGSPTSFWDVTSFETGPRRDFLLNLPKGSLVCVEADAQKRAWKDDDGRWRTDIRLTHRNLEVIFRGRSDSEAVASVEHTEEDVLS